MIASTTCAYLQWGRGATLHEAGRGLGMAAPRGVSAWHAPCLCLRVPRRLRGSCPRGAPSCSTCTATCASGRLRLLGPHAPAAKLSEAWSQPATETPTQLKRARAACGHSSTQVEEHGAALVCIGAPIAWMQCLAGSGGNSRDAASTLLLQFLLAAVASRRWTTLPAFTVQADVQRATLSQLQHKGCAPPACSRCHTQPRRQLRQRRCCSPKVAHQVPTGTAV